MRKKARKKKEGKYARLSSRKALRQGEDPGRAVQIAGLAEAQMSVAGAKRLRRRAGEVHRKADQLHRSIEQMHETVHSLHPPPAQSGEFQRRARRGESEERHGNGAEEQTRPGKPFHIVGIGASAGGFEAFSDFLKHLPNDTGMAFVLVQHLDPKHKSQLSDLLGRATHVPVLEAKDGMAVEPNHIYVIPANSSIRLTGGRLRLGPRAEDKMPPMPIDVFFRSLAREQQDRSIGIVLSGTGSDGTLGIEAIKGEGGITFAQHERSAKFFGMPRSAIGSGTVDFVMPPEGIAKELARISKHPYVERPEKGRGAAVAGEQAEWDTILEKSQKEMSRLFGLLRARKGVDFSLYKHSTLKRRIVRRLILHKFDSLAGYLAYVEKKPAEVDQLFNDLLIYVTSFFRDPRAFEALKKSIFPRIIKAHTGNSPLRFWVCGCSTGEEAYTLAMSLAEFFDQSRTHRPAQIFASDISEQSIAKARAGIYPQNIVQDVSPERLRRFFVETDGHYEVQKAIRDMCVFARQNVIVDPPFSNLDLILCRNVMIYLGPMLQRKVLPVFHYALRPGGFLMLGTAETVGGATDLFAQVNKTQKIYVRKPTYFRTALELPKRGEEAAEAEPEVLAPSQPFKTPDLQEYVDKILLREFSPAAVVVNSAMEVLQFRGRTGDYLEHSAGAASLNLWRMTHQKLALDLRSAVSRAVKQDITVKQLVRYRQEGEEREVTIQVLPFRAGSGMDRLFLILFQPGSPVVSPAAGPAAKGKESRGKQEVERLKLELMTTRESLQSVVEEQEEKNEELKAANEEIQSSNEELQSTNEELETAKEELQSTNEELMTLNEELQTRNVELSQALNDLTNFLASVNVAMLMLDDALMLRRFTPVAEKMFNLIPSDLGRPLSELSRSIFVADLDKSIASVISTLLPLERDVQSPDGHWYSMRIRPYRTRENKIDGAVVVLIDIDNIKRALELLLSTAKEPLVTLGADLTVRKANASFYQTFHLKPEETEGKFIYEAGDGQWNLLELRKLLEEVLPKNKEVHDFHLEANFRDIGERKLLLNARHFYDEGWGVKMILLAIEDVTRK